MTVRVLQGDALDMMATLPDASIDAVITDPPYCSGSVSESARTQAKSQGVKKFGWFTGDNMGTAGLVFLLRSVAFEAVRLLRADGSMLVFCDWRMVPNLAPAIESAGLRYQNMIVWDKGSAGLGTGFRAQHEIVLHFTAGSPKYHSASYGNVIKSKRVTADEREHQTQKPLDLLEKLIRVVCRPGGVILDPFGGSGSLAVAAESIGRSSILIERSLEHCETARRRVDDASRQGPMFPEL